MKIHDLLATTLLVTLAACAGTVAADLSLPRELTPSPGVPMPDVIEIRGEIYLTTEEFLRINRLREESGEPLYANPRNLAAGTIKQLDSREVA